MNTFHNLQDSQFLRTYIGFQSVVLRIDHNIVLLKYCAICQQHQQHLYMSTYCTIQQAATIWWKEYQ